MSHPMDDVGAKGAHEIARKSFPDRIFNVLASGPSHLVRDGRASMTLCGAEYRTGMDVAFLGPTCCPPNISDKYKCQACWALQAEAMRHPPKQLRRYLPADKLPRGDTRTRAVVDALHRNWGRNLDTTWAEAMDAYCAPTSKLKRLNRYHAPMELGRILRRYATRLKRGVYRPSDKTEGLYVGAVARVLEASTPARRMVPRDCGKQECRCQKLVTGSQGSNPLEEVHDLVAAAHTNMTTALDVCTMSDLPELLGDTAKLLGDAMDTLQKMIWGR